MDWYPWHPLDYEGDTGHLTLEQDAIYRRLIDWYMIHERTIPSDPRALANAARIDIDTWQRNAEVILPYFVPRDSSLMSPRCEFELEEQAKRRKHEADKKRKQRETKALKNNNPVPGGQPGAVPELSPLTVQYSTGHITTDADDRARATRDALEELLGRNPNIVNWSRLDAWLAAGCDPDKDILPAVQSALLRKPPGWAPKTLGYFDQCVAEAKAARLKPMPEVTHEPARIPEFLDRRNQASGDSFIAGAMRAAAGGRK